MVPAELPENRDYQFRSDLRKPAPVEKREQENVKDKEETMPAQLPENRDYQLRSGWRGRATDKVIDKESDNVHR